MPGAQASHGIVEFVQFTPPFDETPTPMPWPPPFDQRSSCHWPIRWSPKTPRVGSTSAFRKLRPPVTAICAASREAQAASGDASAEALTGVVTPATAVLDVMRARALTSAEIQTAFRNGFMKSPLCPLTQRTFPRS